MLCSTTSPVQLALSGLGQRVPGGPQVGELGLGAYDLYLRALAVFYPITKDRVAEALRLLDQAIAIDRHYGPALSWAICHFRLVQDGWAEDPDTSRRNAVGLARKALEAAQNDQAVLVNAALVLAHFGEDIGTMIGLVDRALAVNPSFARGWNVSGRLRIWRVGRTSQSSMSRPLGA